MAIVTTSETQEMHGVCIYKFVCVMELNELRIHSAPQLDISNLKTRSAKILVRQMGHLEVDVTFGIIHLLQMKGIRRQLHTPRKNHTHTCNRRDVHRRWPLAVSPQTGPYHKFYIGTE